MVWCLCAARRPSQIPFLRREDITSGSYSAARQREHYLVGTDPLRRGETDEVDRLYSLYATSALSNYNRQHPYEGRKPDLVAAPVSSRYSFSGPSMCYRWHFYYSSSVLFVSSLANFFLYMSLNKSLIVDSFFALKVYFKPVKPISSLGKLYDFIENICCILSLMVRP